MMNISCYIDVTLIISNKPRIMRMMNLKVLVVCHISIKLILTENMESKLLQTINSRLSLISTGPSHLYIHNNMQNTLLRANITN